MVAGGLANPQARTIAIVGFAWAVFAVGTVIAQSLVTMGWRLTIAGRAGDPPLSSGGAAT